MHRFASFLLLLAAARAAVLPPDAEESEMLLVPSEYVKRAAEDVPWTFGPGKRAARYTPYVSVGVLSDMERFFDNLKNNLETLESLPEDEQDAILGRPGHEIGTSNVYPWRSWGHPRKALISIARSSGTLYRSSRRQDAEKEMRPKATAAYLHALRNHKPSYKIRNFVAEPEPSSMRNSKQYDPSWLWTGLGRKR